MKRTWTIIGVHDVPRSFQWYQSLFGQSSRAPAHSDFGQLLDDAAAKTYFRWRARPGKVTRMSVPFTFTFAR